MDADPILNWNLNLVGMGVAAAGVVALLTLLARRFRRTNGDNAR